MDTEELTIQQVADETGLSVHTLRYYERIGLITPVARAPSGHRRYTADDVGWITFLKRLRSTGMSISRMKRYADLQREGEDTFLDRLALLKEHRCAVQARIQELCDNLTLLEYKIDYYSNQAESMRREAEPVQAAPEM